MPDDDESRSLRVLVVSASMGAGHDSAAAELRRRLTGLGHDTWLVDLLETSRRGHGEVLRALYGTVLRHFPYLYDAWMRTWLRWPRVVGRLTSIGQGSYADGLLAEVRAFDPHVVVSTYNLASQLLGRLRREGRLSVPVATYVTDPGPHPYWVDPDVDVHLAVTPETEVGLRALGASGVVHAGPLVRPAFRDLPSQDAARRTLALPSDACVALVTAGSWGVGSVERTVRVLADVPGVLPVTLCGHDRRLLRRLTRAGLGRPVGWTDDVPTYMAAADVLVDNAGGLTCLEALVAGLPVVLFRPLPGHGRVNAATLDAAHRALWAPDASALVSAVRLLAEDSVTRRRQVAAGRAIAAGDVALHVVDLGEAVA